MKGKTKILIGVLVLAIAGGIYGYYSWNKPHRDIHDEAADFESSALELAGEFQKDSKAASTKYHDKVISFKGAVSAIEPGDSLTTISFKGNEFCGLVCEMLPGTKEAVDKVKVGSEVQVKAFFMGFIDGDVDFGMPGDIMFKKGLIIE